jgi:hypothetical protein
MEEKEWSEPELIVLVRSKPEEAVLTVCKGDGIATTWGSMNTSCHYLSVCITICAAIASS